MFKVGEAGSKLIAHSSKYYNITTTLQQHYNGQQTTEGGSRKYGIAELRNWFKV